MASPSTISGLTGWWKASAITGLVDGDQVATWPDSSGNGYSATQATSAKRPVWRSSSLNSQPGVEFIGDDVIAAGMPTLSQPGTLVIVAKVTGSTSATFFFTDGGDSSNRWVIGSNLDTTTNQIGVYAGATGLIDKYNTDNTAHVFTTVVNGSSSTFRRDGAAGSTGNPGTMAFTGPTFGARFSQAATFLTGLVYEVILYNRVLTTGEQATVHSYVQDTYAITVTDYVASGNVTVSGPVATATALAPAGTVSTGTTISGPVATATALAPAGTVSTTQNATISGPVATATAAALAGTVSANGSVTITGVVATATTSAPAGTVTTTSGGGEATPAVGDIEDGFPVFDTDADPLTGGDSFVFEPPVVLEATRASWPARITMPRGISVLKESGSYRQIRVPTDDEVRAADVAYIGGGVYPVDESEADDLTEAGYGERITTVAGDGVIVSTGVMEVDGVLFPYVDTEGAEDDEQAELDLVEEDGVLYPRFTTS